jgi:hypothetical protein
MGAFLSSSFRSACSFNQREQELTLRVGVTQRIKKLRGFARNPPCALREKNKKFTLRAAEVFCETR